MQALHMHAKMFICCVTMHVIHLIWWSHAIRAIMMKETQMCTKTVTATKRVFCKTFSYWLTNQCDDGYYRRKSLGDFYVPKNYNMNFDSK